MPELRVECFSLSLGGCAAGLEQSLDNPMGKYGMSLHCWALQTGTFRRMFGQEGGNDGIEEGFAQRGFQNVGAWILGRSMFAPGRRGRNDDGWQGWWGDVPPCRWDVFVLTHHPRGPVAMQGGTVFHFVTGGLAAVLSRAFAAADGKDVRLGGGVAAVRAGLQAWLIDRLHLAVSPVLPGRGENLWQDLDLPALGYRVAATTAGEAAAHLELEKP